MLKHATVAMLCMIAPAAHAANITLTDKADRYTLETAGAAVYGRAGDDRLLAIDINGILAGQEGNDTLIGRNYSKGHVVLRGGPGDDTIYCDGDCTANGGAGGDRIFAVSSTLRDDGRPQLWGAGGPDLFDVLIVGYRRDFSATIRDMTTADKLRVRLPSPEDYSIHSLLDLFAAFDRNGDGVLDDYDNGGWWEGWELYLWGQDWATGAPATILLYNVELPMEVRIEGLGRLTRANLVR
jgi:hypothetical protein